MNTKTYTLSTGQVVKALNTHHVGSDRYWLLSVDGEEVATLRRSGSSPHIKTRMFGAPAEYDNHDYIVSGPKGFERCVIAVALAGLSWKRLYECGK